MIMMLMMMMMMMMTLMINELNVNDDNLCVYARVLACLCVPFITLHHRGPFSRLICDGDADGDDCGGGWMS